MGRSPATYPREPGDHACWVTEVCGDVAGEPGTWGDGRASSSRIARETRGGGARVGPTANAAAALERPSRVLLDRTACGGGTASGWFVLRRFGPESRRHVKSRSGK